MIVWTFFDENGPNWYSCDISGQNLNQQYLLRSDGRIERSDHDCLLLQREPDRPVKKKACKLLGADEGIFDTIHTFEPSEWQLYRKEVAKHRYAEEFPYLLDH